MLLDNILDLLLLKVLELILLEIETNLGTTAKMGIDSVESESATSSGPLDVLLIIVVF